MADIKISELGAASAVNATDLFPMTSSGVTVKATAQQIKNYIGVGNLSNLNTTDKSSAVAAINEVNTKVTKTEDLISNSGDAYSTSKAYKVGDLCIHDDKLYRCITDCSAGSWTTNQSCFTADTLTNVVAVLNSDLTGMFAFKTFTKSINLNANTGVSGNIPLPSINGYKAYALIGFDTGSVRINMTNLSINGSDKAVYYKLYNSNSIAETGTLLIRIGYIKTNALVNLDS